MFAKLIFLDDEHRRTIYRLKKFPTVIGRGRDADLTVAHPLVSRHHCEIYLVENTLCVRDLGSLNGTFVGEFRITEAALESGDQLTIGSAKFEVVVEHAQEELMPPESAADTSAQESIDVSPVEEPLSEVDFSDIGLPQFDETEPSPPSKPPVRAKEKAAPPPVAPKPQVVKKKKPAEKEPAEKGPAEDKPPQKDSPEPAATQGAPAANSPEPIVPPKVEMNKDATTADKAAPAAAPPPPAPDTKKKEADGAGQSKVDLSPLGADSPTSDSGVSGLGSFLGKLE